jgi:hypothetical protein
MSRQIPAESALIVTARKGIPAEAGANGDERFCANR